MKKLLSLCLLLGLLLASLAALPVSAAGDQAAAVQIARTMGILDESSAPEQLVTRSTLARMLVMASAYRDSMGDGIGSGALFPDAPRDDTTAEAIRIAVQNGWMSGYSDGRFYPQNPVKLEEACTAVLRLLSYDTSKLNGRYPLAQLNKASELGLRAGLTCAGGQNITVGDMTRLLYNAFSAPVSGGDTAYAVTLGYTVTDGVIDAASVTRKNMKGPFIYHGEALPLTSAVMYVNGDLTAERQLKQNDVYYYNPYLSTLWVYTRRTAGSISDVAPSASNPTSVTVAGETYTIASSEAAYRISALSGGGPGKPITLLLGMDNEVVGVLANEETNSVFYGVVESAGRVLTTQDGADVLQQVKIRCTDGMARSFEVDKVFNFPCGWLVRVQVDADGVHITRLSGGTVISGEVNADGTMLGAFAFAPDAKILDVGIEGDSAVIRPARLAGSRLSPLHIGYCVLDELGRIEHLLLNNVTGDIWTYGCLTNLKLNGPAVKTAMLDTDSVTSALLALYNGVMNGTLFDDMWRELTSNTGVLIQKVIEAAADSTSGTARKVLQTLAGGAQYTYLVKGSSVSANTPIPYPVVTGGIAVRNELNGAVRAMVQLTPYELTSLGAGCAETRIGTLPMADDVQVYLWYMGQYYYTTLASVNAEDHWLTGWVDPFGCPAGGRVRVVVALRRN